MQLYRKFAIFALLACLTLPSAAIGAESGKNAPLMIQEQGSFAAGGTIIQNPGTFDPSQPANPAGQSYHGDHAYIFYQKPVNARKYPLVFLHGAGQFSKTWESTPDGREGFQKGQGWHKLRLPRITAGENSETRSLFPPLQATKPEW